jgi:signal transduction histidine kinase
VLARATAPPGIALHRDGDPAAPVPVSQDVLVRITANLVENALRHAGTTVRVTVRAATDGECARLVVTDDGPGIPAAERDRVFARFTRLDGGRGRDSGGAGLGLAIVQELVRAAHGQVELQDAGPGLRVVVELGGAGGGRSGTVTALSPRAPHGSPDGPTR